MPFYYHRRNKYDSEEEDDEEDDEDDEEDDEDDEEDDEDQGETESDNDDIRPVPKKARQSPNNAGIYVLQDPLSRHVYVGKTLDMQRRMQEHANANQGVSLIRQPLITQGSMTDLESWERNEVLTRMLHDGLDRVRGWKFTRRGPLSSEQAEEARKDICEKFDLCRRCGRKGHFQTACFARSFAPWCGGAGIH
jgi:hypothetical protein